MYLSTLANDDYVTFVGTPDAPVVRATAVITVAVSEDRQLWLMLTGAPDDVLTPCATVPDGYTFVYATAWGLTTNDMVVHLVIQDARRRDYPPMTDYVDGIVKSDAAQVQTYIDACLAVKARNVKGF